MYVCMYIYIYARCEVIIWAKFLWVLIGMVRAKLIAIVRAQVNSYYLGQVHVTIL